MLLTAIAIVLGVATMSGAYDLTDTIDKAFDAIFVESYVDTDAVVTARRAGVSFEGESAPPAPIPESVLEQVRAECGDADLQFAVPAGAPITFVIG